MRITVFGVVATAFYLIIDLYVFWVLRSYLLSAGIRRSALIQIVYLTLGIGSLLFFYFVPKLIQTTAWKPLGMTVFAVVVSWFWPGGWLLCSFWWMTFGG